MLPSTSMLLRRVRLSRSDRQQFPRAAVDGMTCADARIETNVAHKIVKMARHRRWRWHYCQLRRTARHAGTSAQQDHNLRSARQIVDAVTGPLSHPHFHDTLTGSWCPW